MKPKDFEALVNRLTYKNNATIAFYTFSLEFRVSFHVPDTNKPLSEKIHISISTMLTREQLADFDEAAALHFILFQVDAAEQHETREWLMLDGVKIFDPHKDAK